jgi:hypothetical protein
MKDHRLIDERSLAFARRIAEELRRNPALIEKAKSNLERWMPTASAGLRPVLQEWKGILLGPFDGVLAVLETTDERATRLRQSSPFCGILTQAERSRIINEFQRRESSAA